MREKNIQEDNQFTTQNLEIYKNKSITIAAETAERIKQIQIKKYMEEQEEKVALQKEIDDDFVRRSKARESADVAAFNKTDELDFQRKSLELKYQMIYATETEQKLAQISLEYARKRKELESSESVTDYQRTQLERQEQMEKMFVTMGESAKRTQEVFDSVWGNLSSAIDNFVKTGKLNMKDFARSVIQDLIAIQMKAAAMKFLGALFGGSQFTPGSANFVGPMQINPLNLSPRASGGSVTNNTPYMVGERGPELFVPSGSGTIIPNNQMGGMGGTTNVTNNYINAIDTKSFEDRLLGSSNAIWAANMYANKSLAVNRGRA
jgi:lambda family phage tail tape measure protein